MFEKEAEEYCMHQSLLEDVRDNICKAFEDGATFGYNKANEWHKVADGDLPKHEVNVLVLYNVQCTMYNVQCVDIAHYNYDYKEWHFRDSIVRDVIALKEIIPSVV